MITPGVVASSQMQKSPISCSEMSYWVMASSESATMPIQICRATSEVPSSNNWVMHMAMETPTGQLAAVTMIHLIQ